MDKTFDFIDGYAAAVADLGREGDHRNVDWSEPYRHLSTVLASLKTAPPDAQRIRQAGVFAEELRRMARDLSYGPYTRVRLHDAAATIDALRQSPK